MARLSRVVEKEVSATLGDLTVLDSAAKILTLVSQKVSKRPAALISTGTEIALV